MPKDVVRLDYLVLILGSRANSQLRLGYELNIDCLVLILYHVFFSNSGLGYEW